MKYLDINLLENVTYEIEGHIFKAFSEGICFYSAPIAVADKNYMKAIIVRAIEQKPTVLIVEDEPEIVEVIRDLLSDRFEILDAPNVEAAKNLLHTRADIRLAVIDLVLPGGNGFCLKDECTALGIPSFFMTGAGAAMFDEFRLAEQDVINKPFSFTKFQKRIEDEVKEYAI